MKCLVLGSLLFVGCATSIPVVIVTESNQSEISIRNDISYDESTIFIKNQHLIITFTTLRKCTAVINLPDTPPEVLTLVIEVQRARCNDSFGGETEVASPQEQNPKLDVAFYNNQK